MQTTNFKQTVRNVRTQTVEENFGKGMYYSSTPLTEGYCHTLVNMDISEDGTTLTQRPAFKGLQLGGKNTTWFPTTESITTVKDSKFIEECILQDKEYNKSPTYLFSRNHQQNTCNIDMFIKNSNEEYTFKSIPGIVTHTPKVSDIHKVPLASTQTTQVVGCTAWNNEFYTFQKRDTGNSLVKLTNNSTGVSVIEPKPFTNAEHELLGYNVLLPDMFKVPECEPFRQAIAKIDFTKDYQLDIVDGETLKHVDNSYILKNKLYYIVANYHIPTAGGSAGTHSDLSAEYILYSTGGQNAVTTFPSELGGKTIPGLERYSTRTDEGASYSDGVYKFRLYISYSGSSSKYLSSNYNTLLYFPVTFSEEGFHSFELHCALNWALYENSSAADPWTQGSKSGILNGSQLALTVVSKVPEELPTIKNYDLSTCTSMVFWQERLWVAGVTEDPSMLFCSAPQNPERFPYNDVHVFNESIIKMVPLKDSLIVFTETKVHRLSYNSSNKLNTEIIQSNLYITPGEAHLIQSVKNMLYFKSGNYYYMIVPKANSLTNELTLAPVSVNITQFLDNFQENLYKVLKKSYNIDATINNVSLIDFYNFLDYEDVYNVFKLKGLDPDTSIYFMLLYNTVKRHWRIYILCTNTQVDAGIQFSDHLAILRNDATRKGEYIQEVLGPSGTNTMSFHTFEWSFKFEKDDYGIYEKDIETYLDTGYREHASTIKKRYREVQFNFQRPVDSNNQVMHVHMFNTSFCVDSEARQNKTYYTPEVVNNIIQLHPYSGGIRSVDLLHPTEFWALEGMSFNHKVRMPVSGKGYAPRLIIKGITGHHRNSSSKITGPGYSISKISYVYRVLNSR